MAIEIAAIGAVRPWVLAELEREFVVHRLWGAPDRAAALRSLGDRIKGVVSNGMAGLPTEIIDVLPNLEICAIHGVGLETTDLDLARARNITVTTAPVLYDDVSDLAILLGMAACRRLVEADRFVRTGTWPERRMDLGHRFSGKRSGIVGLGRIGSAVARRLGGFDMSVAYTDPQPKPDVPFARYDDAVSLARDVDLLFLCAAGGYGGGPIVTAQVLDALGPGGVFVNVARGWIVDEPALVAALQDGRLGAAGLDVFENEPHVPEELLQLDNVVLSPHIASNTHETTRDMGRCVVDNLHSWFAGKGALTPVV